MSASDCKACGGSGVVPSLVEVRSSKIETTREGSDPAPAHSYVILDTPVQVLSKMPERVSTCSDVCGTHVLARVYVSELRPAASAHFVLETDGILGPVSSWGCGGRVELSTLVPEGTQEIRLLVHATEPCACTHGAAEPTSMSEARLWEIRFKVERGFGHREDQDELEELLDEVDLSRKQRDEAQRELLELESEGDFTEHNGSPQERAAKRGWTCYPSEEG